MDSRSSGITSYNITPAEIQTAAQALDRSVAEICRLQFAEVEPKLQVYLMYPFMLYMCGEYLSEVLTDGASTMEEVNNFCASLTQKAARKLEERLAQKNPH